jgi:hypothetical protein
MYHCRKDAGVGEGSATERDEEAVRRFIERFAAVLVESGFQRTPARIFVALLASERGRMTAAESAASSNALP